MGGWQTVTIVATLNTYLPTLAASSTNGNVALESGFSNVQKYSHCCNAEFRKRSLVENNYLETFCSELSLDRVSAFST